MISTVMLENCLKQSLLAVAHVLIVSMSTICVTEYCAIHTSS
jgi:hypothetical protein